MPDRLELAVPGLATLGARMLALLPEPLRRRALQSAFDRARDAFNRRRHRGRDGSVRQDVEYVPPPPLGGGVIRGLPAVLDFWRAVFRRYERSTIENLSLEEAEPGRFVRTARLSHHCGPDGEDLSYTIVQSTWLEAGRVVRQVNEILPG